MIGIKKISYRILPDKTKYIKRINEIKVELYSSRRVSTINNRLVYNVDSSWEGGAKEIEITNDIIRKYSLEKESNENCPINSEEISNHMDWSNVELEKLLKDESWIKEIGDEFKKSYMTELTEFLRKEGKTKTIYPPCNEVFNALNLCPFHKVKVVIIGQDPYHNPGQAHGLCFSVKSGPIPPSLINIFKELKDDIKTFKRTSNHGNLESWAKQGVLLLNACLTVEKNKPNSHKDLGWEIFSDRIIEKINTDLSNVVFLLWGNYAQKKEKLIDCKKHYVLKASHPSPYSANRGFIGCKHFSKVNEYLIKNGKDPINWNI